MNESADEASGRDSDSLPPDGKIWCAVAIVVVSYVMASLGLDVSWYLWLIGFCSFLYVVGSSSPWCRFLGLVLGLACNTAAFLILQLADASRPNFRLVTLDLMANGVAVVRDRLDEDGAVTSLDFLGSDGWGRSFDLIETEGRIFLRSKGQDGLADTPDDMRVIVR